jgi:hypothetical protein
MNLRELEIHLRALRNKEKSQDAYPVRTGYYSLYDFLTKFGSPIKSNGNIVYLDKQRQFPKYCNINNTKDIIEDNLNVVCMGYDSMVDRFITWFKEQYRIKSYEKSLKNSSHIGTIGLIDLKSNIESLESLKTDSTFIDYQEELQSEIDYWKSYYYEKDGKTVRFRYYVIFGKNRSLLAIPKIYEDCITKNNIDLIKNVLELEIKVWTKFVSREYKTELYRNEKNNMKDTDLQELIGYGGPMAEFIAKYPQEKLPKTVLPHLFKDDDFLMIYDRELLCELYSVHSNMYGHGKSNEFIRKQFIDGLKIQSTFPTYLNFYFNVIKAWVTYRENGEHKRYPIASGNAWRILLYEVCRNVKGSKLDINLSEKDTYKQIINTFLEVRAELEQESDVYAYLTGKSTPLTVENLWTGLSSSTCIYRADFGKFDSNFQWDKGEIEKYKDIISGYQWDVMTKIFLDRFWQKLGEDGLIVLPAKRGFEPNEVSYIVKRDEYKVRINGEVYNSNNEVIQFSDEHPNDPFILEYGPNVEYITLPYSKLMGDDIQIDHIPAYSKNREAKDLDKCEATSANFNNWKNNREAVYQSVVLEEILDRKEIYESKKKTPKTIENFV